MGERGRESSSFPVCQCDKDVDFHWNDGQESYSRMYGQLAVGEEIYIEMQCWTIGIFHRILRKYCLIIIVTGFIIFQGV